MSISTKFIKQQGHFRSDISRGSVICSRGGEKIGSAGFTVSTAEKDQYINFRYTYTNNNTDYKEDMNYMVRLITTPCNYGGHRWWFICPLLINGNYCGRRVGVLYLAGKYFGCRHCYNLTYTSSKEHDNRMAIFKKHPDLIFEALNHKKQKDGLSAAKAVLDQLLK
ncbi:hypothetical protein ACFL52_02625 [Candidatus Margulisiibacteriota bacterium]